MRKTISGALLAFALTAAIPSYALTEPPSGHSTPLPESFKAPTCWFAQDGLMVNLRYLVSHTRHTPASFKGDDDPRRTHVLTLTDNKLWFDVANVEESDAVLGRLSTAIVECQQSTIPKVNSLSVAGQGVVGATR